MGVTNRITQAYKEAIEYLSSVSSAIIDKYIKSPRVLRGLHTIGLTNLTDEQVDRYALMYATQDHSIADKVLTPKVLRFLHTAGLTNLTDEQVDRYCKQYQQRQELSSKL